MNTNAYDIFHRSVFAPGVSFFVFSQGVHGHGNVYRTTRNPRKLLQMSDNSNNRNAPP